MSKVIAFFWSVYGYFKAAIAGPLDPTEQKVWVFIKTEAVRFKWYLAAFWVGFLLGKIF